MAKKYLLPLLLCCLLLPACGRSRPQQLYLLNAVNSLALPAPAGVLQTPALGIAPLKIAAYLDGQGIATRRAAGNQLKLDDYHQWAGTLQSNVTHVLRENLSRLLDTDKVYLFPWSQSLPLDFSLNLEIINLDGEFGGQARLKAHWSLFAQPGKKLLTTRFSDLREEIAGSDYNALVSAQSRLLAGLSREIATTIRQHQETTPSQP
ncbi:MAG: membrane integrity-associated transporter subunit PqiC [Deltaproteobacteria bacterium]|nr:membrane integrity-associated transporter subunit PqiC [Deltaproteobacteria bacterium]